MNQTRPALIGLDWGSSSFRAWVFDEDGEAGAPYRAQDGVLTGRGDPWERLDGFLRDWLGAWPDAPIVACGMVGSEAGLVDAGYLSRLPMGDDLVSAESAGRRIHVAPGVSQSSPADVMRGEETILVGLDRPDGLVCMPGTHTKHILFKEGRVAWFQTELVGEARALHLLHGALRPPDGVEQVFDTAIFDLWAERAVDADVDLSPFAVRAARILGQLDAAHTDAALTGVLVGRDCAARYEPGDEVLLVGAGPMAEAYRRALGILSVDATFEDSEAAVCDGLWALADEAGLIGDQEDRA